MLRLLSYAAAFGLGALSLCANVIYANELGSAAPAARYMWLGVAVCSAAWTACGLSVVWRQAGVGNNSRAAGAAALLVLALTFDALAAYDLSRRELLLAADAAAQDRIARADISATMDRLRASIAGANGAPPTEAARGAVSAVAGLVADDDCRAVTTPNSWAKARADRVRNLCDQLADARRALAAAVARDTDALALEAVRQRLVSMGPPTAGSARTDLLPTDVVAALPVVLLLCGALFGLWCVETPDAAPSTPAAEKPLAITAPIAVPAPIDAAGPSIVSRLQAIRVSPPAKVRVDGEGWIRGPQRAMAKAAGLPLSRFNDDLHAAAGDGAVQLDTSGRSTAVRISTPH